MEQEGDEESPHTTVAVEERVDGFELGMEEPTLQQLGCVRLRRHVLFPCVECAMHLRRGRRYVGGMFEASPTRTADPVLARPEFARGLLAPSYAPKQSSMDLSDESQGQRQ